MHWFGQDCPCRLAAATVAVTTDGPSQFDPDKTLFVCAPQATPPSSSPSRSDGWLSPSPRPARRSRRNKNGAGGRSRRADKAEAAVSATRMFIDQCIGARGRRRLLWDGLWTPCGSEVHSL